jgi:starch synthase
MSKKKILIITQEMEPYTALSTISEIANKLPLFLNDNSCEIRILMPRFGTVNERRHRLHEVVRLSGMNIIVNDDDFPLIIKVASLPTSRIQVYFLDMTSLNGSLYLKTMRAFLSMTILIGWYFSVKGLWRL